MRVGRPLDRNVDDAIVVAALALLGQRGFAAMTMEAVASAAGVGKPAIYRRYPDKPSLVAAVLARQLPVMDAPDLGDTHTELWLAMSQELPADGLAYVRLIGGLIAAQEQHPELIEAFRGNVLLPRRDAFCSLIQRGKARGDVRQEIDPVAALDALAGSFLARVFAGLDTGPRWRTSVFETWWETIAERQKQ
jgi:AcrR family transcriptional regulator